MSFVGTGFKLIPEKSRIKKEGVDGSQRLYNQFETTAR
jgi:hypothetical protein